MNRNWKLCLLAASATLVGTSAQAALIANWNLDESSGSIVDLQGNHPLGIPTGAPTYGAAGVPNGSYGAITIANAGGTSIDYGPVAVDEFFTVGLDNNNPVMNLDATGSFTAMGWMNPNALLDATPRSYKILSTGTEAAAGRGWGLALRLTQIDGTGSSLRFTGFGIADNDSLTFTITPGEWVHLAVTYSAGSISYFLNGNFLDTDTSSFGNESTAARLVIGSRFAGNDSDQMNGRLDGIRVYDTLLTENQIRQAAIDSVSIIPEPSCGALALAGIAGLLRRKNRAAK
jgi:hypothetical protein